MATLRGRMRILITGAAGMLGVDVHAAAGAAGHDVVALARAELDITDAQAVTQAIAQARPDALINCAAYTNVDGAESDEQQALAVNGSGAGNLAAAATAAGAWTVHVSTDYVFDGGKPDAYVESDPTGPVGAYGRTKLAGELAVAQAAPDSHTIVRTAWVFGPAGHCFPKTILRLAAGRDELKVVDDQVGCPTYTGHLAAALVQLADPGSRIPGVVHVAGGGRCSWFEFATAIVGAGELDCDVRPCTTAEFPLPAARPAMSVLVSERGERVPRLPSWRAGLGEFMGTQVAAR
jgi:dTDP-4-dehydrorhamnose reductase